MSDAFERGVTAIRRLVLISLVPLALNGCACLIPIGLTTLGAAGTVITHDPGHVVQPFIVELEPCLRRTLKGERVEFQQ